MCPGSNTVDPHPLTPHPSPCPRFEDYYANRVAQLTFTFPESAVTSTGAPFWSAPKRFPKPLLFNSTDESYVSFVQSGAILKAGTYGIPVPAWAHDSVKLAAAVGKVDMPVFKPKEVGETRRPRKQSGSGRSWSDCESGCAVCRG